jgi:NHLM bacteriocin system ABC transporter ATP-binding protein
VIEKVPEGEGTSRPPKGEGTSDRELFLLRLRYREGRLVQVAGNRPVLLDDPELAWVVFSGYVDVFAVRLEDGKPVGARRHLFRSTDGAALFGMVLGGRQVGLLATGAPGTQLLRVRRSGLERLGAAREFAGMVAELIENWVDGLSSGVDQDLPPRDYEPVEAGRELTLPSGGTVRTRRGVVWISQREGSSRFLGRVDVEAADGDAPFPLSPRAWLESTGPWLLDAVDTRRALEGRAAWAALGRFQELVLGCIEEDAARRERAQIERLDARAGADRARLEAAYSRLASVLSPLAGRPAAGLASRDPLLAACQLVGEPLGIAMRPHRAPAEGHVAADPLADIARASRARTRRVALRGEWWKGESGPLLGYLEADKRPVALLPTSARGYTLHEPATGRKEPVTADVAAALDPFAYTFYRRFEDRPLTARDLLGFGLRGSRRDVTMVLLMGSAIGLLGMVVPLATGALFDLIIPATQRPLLLQVAVALAVAAFAAAMFQVVQAVAVLRIEGKLDASIQAAVIDRLFDLPATFFRQYSAGDLGSRALGFAIIRQTLSRLALSSIIASLFSLYSFALLFVLDFRLALVATGLAIILILFVAWTGLLQVNHQRAMGELAGRLSGTVLQLINGVTKFRVAGAESRAFAHWAGQFTEQRRVAHRARTVRNGVMVFTAAFPVVAAMAIFGAVGLGDGSRISTGTFLAFNVAFTQFVTAALGVTVAFAAIVQVVPLYERARPILQARPEVDETKADPGELGGELEVNHVSFRYQANGPLVLDDVSFHVRPGEFVALVGPSGSGKSTLLRLLLGFEAPDSGAILYDGRDLAGLDVRAVRRQIGSVIQNGRLMTGDIFSNIIGSLPLTTDDAWEAARMAGLDEDIRQMPMGMHTVISEGGGTFSGGQRQRLLIARAIVSKPRIVFFDEATSALDNRTQETVIRSLESLAATRVVIAHRLSTIINADRIYVVQGGRIVESGTYRELIQKRGLFADLARRQIA